MIDFGALLALLPYALVFGATVLAILGGLGLLDTSRRIRSRLSPQAADAALSTGKPSLVRDDMPRLLRSLIAPIEDRIEAGGADARSQLRRRLMQAGFHSPQAVPLYLGARLTLTAALPLLFLVANAVVDFGKPANVVVSIVMVLLGLGYMGPAIYLSRRLAHRQAMFRDGFPDALDLLVVCVDAGLGVDAAIARVSDEITLAHPLLGEQFRLMALELRAGKGREDAFRNFAERMGVEEVSTLIAMLIQSAAIGTSIADALRVHANEMRAHRMLKAEEKAQALGVKLSFPLVGLIVPSLLIAVAAPAAVRLIRAMGPLIDQASM